MRISEAARRLGTSARMLRYREELGLLPQVRDPLLGGTPRLGGPSHRQFSEADLEAVAVALELERRYDISPASLAFELRVLAEPPVRAAVRRCRGPGPQAGPDSPSPGPGAGLREGTRAPAAHQGLMFPPARRPAGPPGPRDNGAGGLGPAVPVVSGRHVG